MRQFSLGLKGIPWNPPPRLATRFYYSNPSFALHKLHSSTKTPTRAMSSASAQLGQFKIPQIENEPMVGTLGSLWGSYFSLLFHLASNAFLRMDFIRSPLDVITKTLFDLAGTIAFLCARIVWAQEIRGCNYKNEESATIWGSLCGQRQRGTIPSSLMTTDE